VIRFAQQLHCTLPGVLFATKVWILRKNAMSLAALVRGHPELVTTKANPDSRKDWQDGEFI
jgi:hypothetical protein